ncbi:MAG: hypothetical protein ACRDVP_10600 [Acidimicrobiales bacterium]
MGSATQALRPAPFLSWREARWPRANWARWALRLAIATPYAALADLANHEEGPSAGNQALHAQAYSLHWLSAQFGWLVHASPPLTLAVGRLFPGGPGGLAIAGALCAGVLAQQSIERLILRSMSTAESSLLVSAVVLTPAFAFLSVGSFGAFLTLCLLSAALTGLLDFTFNRATQSGFIAGIGFGLASLCQLAAVPFAVAGSLLVLIGVPGTKGKGELARGRAAAVIVAFPTVAAIAGWAFLEWRFTGNWTKSFRLADPALLHFGAGVWSSLAAAVDSVAHDLLFAPVLVAAGVILLSRRPRSLLAGLAFMACIVVDLWVGATLSTPTVVVLLGVVGLVLVPEELSVTERAVLWLCAALQLMIAFLCLHFGLYQVASWLHGLIGFPG